MPAIRPGRPPVGGRGFLRVGIVRGPYPVNQVFLELEEVRDENGPHDRIFLASRSANWSSVIQSSRRRHFLASRRRVSKPQLAAALLRLLQSGRADAASQLTDGTSSAAIAERPANQMNLPAIPRIFHEALIDCIHHARAPTPEEVEAMAARIWSDMRGIHSLSSWREVIPGSKDHGRITSAARAALGGVPQE